MSDRDSCIRHVDNIVREIDNLPSSPFWIRDIVQENRYPFPILLDVGDGKQIYITPEINEMLASFSRVVMNVFFQSHKSNFTDSEWDRMVKRAFGAAFVNQTDDLNIEKDAGVILKLVKERLDGWIGDIQEREYVFGCHLCNISDFEPLSIGPVRFEPRLVWLQSMRRDGNISKTSLSRIERVLQGEKLRKRKASEDEACERRILNTIGKCDFVCSVTVSMTGEEAGLQKALTAARLATTVISLAWERPSSALSSIALTFDREPYRQQNLVVIPGRACGWQSTWSYLPGGVTWLREEQWAELRTDFDNLFHCAGEVITYVTHGQDHVSRPKILNALSQAILWFHEGCREQVDAMAIVRFWTAMEALSCGKNEKGILELIKAHLDVKDEHKLHNDIKKIYRGRSRTVHGANDKLGYDWSDSRNYVENLARLCLISCLQWAAEYHEVDDPKCFLKSRT